MDQFEYLSVLLSIIVGLGVSHLLSSAARLVQMRRRIRLHAPTLLWIAFLLLVQIQVWWVGFERANQTEWHFFLFLLYLCIPIGAFLLSYLIVPDLDTPTEVDLRASYHDNRVWLFGVLALIIVVSLLDETVEGGAVPTDLDALFRVGFLVLALSGLVLRSDRAHLILSAGMALSFVGKSLLGQGKSALLTRQNAAMCYIKGNKINRCYVTIWST